MAMICVVGGGGGLFRYQVDAESRIIKKITKSCRVTKDVLVLYRHFGYSAEKMLLQRSDFAAMLQNQRIKTVLFLLSSALF